MANVKDLIDRCKEEEIFTQNLDENLLGMEIKTNRQKVKNGIVEFVTDPEIVKSHILDTAERKIGIVIWFPKDVFERENKS